jgi:hypothetical protein
LQSTTGGQDKVGLKTFTLMVRDERDRGEAGNGPQTGDGGLRETEGATIEASALDAKIDEE